MCREYNSDKRVEGPVTISIIAPIYGVEQYIEDFEVLRRPKILALLEKHTEKQIYIFRTREEAGEFIEVMK